MSPPISSTTPSETVSNGLHTNGTHSNGASNGVHTNGTYTNGVSHSLTNISQNRHASGSLNLRVLGMNSGTAIDGIDCALVRYSQTSPTAPLHMEVLKVGI